MFARREDWMQRLVNAVESARVIPFRYGVHDCCLWAAYCVDEMCDTDLTRQVLEQFNYADGPSADAIIEAGGGLLGLVDQFLGDHVPGAYAAPGDVVLARNGDGTPIVAIVVGHSLVAPQEKGLAILPYDSGVVCWKV